MRARLRHYRYEAIEPRIFLLRQLREVSGTGTVLIALLNVVVGALPVVFVVASSVMIGRVPAAVAEGSSSGAWDALLMVFVVAALAFVGQQLLTPLSVALGQRMKDQVDGRFHERLMDLSLRSTSIAPLEDQAALADLDLAAETLRNGSRTPGDAAAGTLALVVRYTRLLGLLVVLGIAVSWWMAVAVGVVTMTFRLGQRGGVRIYTRLWPVMAPLRRRAEYFRGVGVGADTAKELRVFGLTPWITERYRSSAVEALLPLWRDRRRVSVSYFLWFTAFGLVVACVSLAFMVHMAATGDLALTELVLGLQTTVGAILLGEFYHEADTATQFGMRAARAMDDFERKLDAYPDEDDAQTVGDDVPALRTGVHFSEVSFNYPGTDRAVLDRLDLTLNAGECTAIVGLNGAGKTTLVKLLARLYEPTSGALLMDGRDARTFGVDSWRRQIGVVFQDFNRYELSVRDNIAFGAVHHPVSPEGVADAGREAGITEVVEGLPHGYDTLLARHYDDGVDLSGGQWQRVAIARALYAVRGGAQVLVLDEPTAALDVRAEAAFFDEFATRTAGLTTVLISHRFSSVRHADRIVVLAEGRVIEDGTHDSLLAQGGRYAELFHLQADRFTSDTGSGTVEDVDDSRVPR